MCCRAAVRKHRRRRAGRRASPRGRMLDPSSASTTELASRSSTLRLGRTKRCRGDEPGDLVAGEQRLLEQAFARNTAVIGVRGSASDRLGNRARTPTPRMIRRDRPLEVEASTDARLGFSPNGAAADAFDGERASTGLALADLFNSCQALLVEGNDWKPSSEFCASMPWRVRDLCR